MRTTFRRTGHWLWAISAPLALLLGACGSANANATPTLSVDAIYTSAHETFSAQQATQLALTPPTSTPAPTLFPTLPPLSPIATFSFASSTPGGGVSACDSSAYVADVTIPDGTTMTPGQKFEKKWKLLNNGTCAWSTSYKLVFSSGDLMGGATSLVTVPVPSGNQTDIAVSLTAPTTNGTYTGTWRMQNASSQAFGNFITVVIKVGAGSTATAGPSPTGGPSSTAVPTGAAGTFTISGTISPSSNITFNFTNATSTPTVVLSGSGYYFTVPSGWSGKVAPVKGNGTGWSFASRTYTNVASNLTGEDYQGISITPTP